MIRGSFFLSLLRQQVVFRRLNRRKMASLSAELRNFEQLFFDGDQIPEKAALRHIRNHIRQEISDRLEVSSQKTLTMTRTKNKELYEIWCGKNLRD